MLAQHLLEAPLQASSKVRDYGSENQVLGVQQKRQVCGLWVPRTWTWVPEQPRVTNLQSIQTDILGDYGISSWKFLGLTWHVKSLPGFWVRVQVLDFPVVPSR